MARPREGGTPHKDDPRGLEPDFEGLPIPSPKIITKQVELLDVDTLITGAWVELNPLEYRGKVVRLQVKQKAGSAVNYTVQLLSRDPSTTPHDFDTITPATSYAAASDPVDVPVDKLYENQDDPTMKRSLYAKIVPDNVGTPNDYDIRVTVEQRV